MKRFYTELVRWLILPVVVAAVLVVGLTSGGGPPTVSSAAITQAAALTSRVAGADLRTTITVNVLGHSVTMAGGGYESFITRNGVLNLHVNGLSGVLAGQTFQIRFLFPRLFMRSGLFSSSLPAGKSWLEVNLAQSLQRQGISSSLLSSAGSDPAQVLDYLKGASGNVQDLGTAEIGGVPTTHYHAVVNLRRGYVSLLPPNKRAAARRSLARVAALTGTSQFPVDVWVDARHMVRQERVDLALHRTSLPGGALREVVTVDLSHFGPKPAVLAPPAQQTDNATNSQVPSS